MTVGIVEVHTPTVVPVVDLALVAAHGERPWMVYPVQHRPIRSTMRLQSTPHCSDRPPPPPGSPAIVADCTGSALGGARCSGPSRPMTELELS